MRAECSLRDLIISLGASAAFMLAVMGGMLTENLIDFRAAELLRPLLCLLALGAAGCIVCYITGWQRGLFAWPVALALFFQFYFVINHWLLQPWLIPLTEARPDLGALLWLAPLLACAILLSVLLAWLVLLRRARAPRRLALVMLAIALGAAGATARPVWVGLLESLQPEARMPFTPQEEIQALLEAQPRVPPPDIIVLAPDRYPSNRVLRETFGYDNTAITEALVERGFVVFDDLRANYQSTLLSLSASLSLSHLAGRQPVNVDDLYAAMHYNPAVTRLRRSGYEYEHLGGWHTIGRSSPLADRVYNGTHWLESNISELELNVLALTPVAGVYRTLMSRLMHADGHARYECRRLQRQLRHLRELERGDAPLLVWALLYIPHNPITMNAAGECLPSAVPLPPAPVLPIEGDEQYLALFLDTVKQYRQLFTDYKEALDRELLTIFDAQLQRSRAAGRELVFIVLADEGPYLLYWKQFGDESGLEEERRRTLQEKFGIFGAVYAPPEVKSRICEVRSRVNIWRAALSGLYTVELPPLEDSLWFYTDKSYLQGKRRLLGELHEVTSLLTPQQPDPLGCPRPDNAG